MKIVGISDTHGRDVYSPIPDGDVLVHAGDACMRGTESELVLFNAWLGTLPHKHKLYTPGNHDGFVQDHPEEARAILTNCTLLIEEAVEIDGVKFWMSPYTPEFFDWSFMYERANGAEQWAKMPEGIDVLVTHGPPAGILDTVLRFNKGEYEPESTGCYDLLQRVLKVQPKLHIFGHIHEGYGQQIQHGIKFVNASICTDRYRAINAAHVLELEKS